MCNPEFQIIHQKSTKHFHDSLATIIKAANVKKFE